MQLSRAEFLRLILSGVPAWMGSRQLALLAQSGAIDPRARLSNIIETYDHQGVHRTATPIDSSSGDWLRRLAEVAGAETRLMPFAINRIDVRDAHLEAGGRRIEGLPFFDGGSTGDTGIVGKLGTEGSNADIVVLTLNAGAISSEGQSIEAIRRQTTSRAVVAVTSGGAPGLCPSNAVSFAKPYGLPVLQVGSEHQAFLSQLAGSRSSATFVASTARTPEQAFNVIATVAGRDPNLPPLVVMTPRSGWWQCASERGGGIACWVESIRAVSSSRPPRPVLFIASSGHELGHYGLDAFLQERPNLIRGASAWIHLGANIGAAGGQMSLQSSDDEIEAKALRAIEQAGASVAQRVPRGTVPGGEARNIHVGGGRYLSFLGSGPAFHTQQDRWPGAVDLDRVARFAQAVASLAVTLASDRS